MFFVFPVPKAPRSVVQGVLACLRTWPRPWGEEPSGGDCALTGQRASPGKEEILLRGPEKVKSLLFSFPGGQVFASLTEKQP